MSVIVRGMEMPESCEECRMLTDAGFCSAKPKDFCGYASDFFLIRPDWCPLVEIPEKHGDLIDREVVKQAVYHHLSIKGEENLLPAEKSIFGNLIKAPTIIEAEGAEE